jgi:hypothetical protein
VSSWIASASRRLPASRVASGRGRGVPPRPVHRRSRASASSAKRAASSRSSRTSSRATRAAAGRGGRRSAAPAEHVARRTTAPGPRPAAWARSWRSGAAGGGGPGREHGGGAAEGEAGAGLHGDVQTGPRDAKFRAGGTGRSREGADRRPGAGAAPRASSPGRGWLSIRRVEATRGNDRGAGRRREASAPGSPRAAAGRARVRAGHGAGHGDRSGRRRGRRRPPRSARSRARSARATWSACRGRGPAAVAAAAGAVREPRGLRPAAAARRRRAAAGPRGRAAADRHLDAGPPRLRQLRQRGGERWGRGWSGRSTRGRST